MNEFMDIPGFEGYYQMNILGHVIGLDRWVNAARGGRTFIPSRPLKHRKNSDGYLAVSLCKHGIDTGFKIHVLIAKMFIPNLNNYPLVRHLNDIKTDNRIENLAWGTSSDNMEDCIRNGHHKSPRGITHHWYGKHRPAINKGMKGIFANNTKTLLDVESGIFYYGTADAAAAKNIRQNALICKMNGYQKNNTNLIYV